MLMRKLPLKHHILSVREIWSRQWLMGSRDRFFNSNGTVYSLSISLTHTQAHTHTLNEEHTTAVTFHFFCTCLCRAVALLYSISRSSSSLMGSTAKSQSTAQSQCPKSAVTSKCWRQTSVSNQSVGMLFSVRVFILVFLKTTKLGHLLKSSLERMLSAQMGFLVSVQMKSH